MVKRPKKEKLDDLKDLPSVLIVGGAGFVGSHLCQALLAKSCYVYCLDRLTAEKKSNILRIINQRNFHLIKANSKKPLKGLKFLDFNYIFYLGDIETDFWGVDKFLDLAKKQKAKFLLLSSIVSSKAKQLTEILTSKYFSHFDLDARIVRLIDLYGPRMSLEKEEIGPLFKNIKLKAVFKIAGDGSKALYPLFIDDAIQGLLKAMFSQNSRGKIYSLGGQEITILKFVNILKKESGRTLGVEFVSKEKVKKEPWKKKEVKETKKQLRWQPKASLRTGVKKTLFWLNQFQFFPEEKQRKNIFLKRLLLIFTFILSLLFPFIATLGFYYFQSVRKISGLKNSLVNYNLTLLESEAEPSLAFFEKSKKFLFNLSPTLSFLKLDKQVDVFFDIFDLGIHLAETSELTAQTIRQIDALTSIVLRKQTGDLYSETDQLGFYLEQIRDRLSLMVVGRTKEEIQQIEKQLPFDRKKISLAKEFTTLLPEILGYSDKKVYLVLLQNNLELRPTGGFISGYGLLTFEKGKLLDFLVKDSQTIDSQLKGVIEPPAPLKEYLGEESWYFRDSNWQPHFSDAAAEAEWFLEKSLKRTVDGTIGLNLYAFQDLLEVLGPVELEAQGEFITSDNILERGQYYLPIKTGSDQSFLVQIAEAVFNKIKEGEKKQWILLAQKINQGLEEKQVLLSFHDQKTAAFFNQNGWDGSIRKISDQERLLTDYLMINEANLSINKANYFINREIVQEVAINEEGEILEKTTITYQNTSSSLRPPGGSYKNYLRVYLPLNSTLETIKAGNNQQNLAILSSAKVDKFEEYDKKGLGFLIEVPIQETRIIEVVYKLKDKLVFKNNLGSYAFYWQKQPGTGVDPLIFKINYPESFEIIETVPQTETSSRGATFETTTEKDRLFLTSFNKKD